MKKSLLFCSLALATIPTMALADCRFPQARNLQLDLTGVNTVVFNVNDQDLTINAVSTNGRGALNGWACATSTSLLPGLQVTQAKSGDTLTVTLHRQITPPPGRKSYAYLKLNGTIPNNIDVRVNVRSGDFKVQGAQSLYAEIDSGEVEGYQIPGQVVATVRSGDLDVKDIGSLTMASIGSGEVTAKYVYGPVNISNIGSGELELKYVEGEVKIGSIGSGEAEICNVSGQSEGGSIPAANNAGDAVAIGTIGSGEVEICKINGNVNVAYVTSGKLEVEDVEGNLTVQGKGSKAKIKYEDIAGTIRVSQR